MLDIDDAILFAARDDREFVMSKVLEDLDYACENCLGTDVYKGVINKWVVLAFKSRVCLYEGTFRKYHSVNPSTNAAGTTSMKRRTIFSPRQLRQPRR